MRSSMVKSTTDAMIMLVAAVLQPALKFTADRANPPASFSRSFHDQLRMLLAMCFCFFDLTASDIA